MGHAARAGVIAGIGLAGALLMAAQQPAEAAPARSPLPPVTAQALLQPSDLPFRSVATPGIASDLGQGYLPVACYFGEGNDSVTSTASAATLFRKFRYAATPMLWQNMVYGYVDNAPAAFARLQRGARRHCSGTSRTDIGQPGTDVWATHTVTYTALPPVEGIQRFAVLTTTVLDDPAQAAGPYARFGDTLYEVFASDGSLITSVSVLRPGTVTEREKQAALSAVITVTTRLTALP